MAFGRNSIPDKDLASVRRMREKEGSDFAAIKKLAACGFKGGTPNEKLAQTVLHCIAMNNLPAIVQWEIAVVLLQTHLQKYGEQWLEQAMTVKKFFILWPRPEQTSYRTREVLDDALTVMRHNGWQIPLLLGHDLHLPRIYMLARKMGLQPIVAFDSIIRSFDSGSVQPPTSSLWRWLMTYEPWARMHHLLHGWV